MPEFLYQFLPGDRPGLAEGPAAWTPADEAIAADHTDYLRRAAEAGIVVLAGRSQDWAGPAIVIIEVPDREAAERFAAEDPFVSSGLFRAGVHPFRSAFMRPAGGG